MKKWNVTYCNRKVYDAVQEWPKGIQAKYLRIIDLIEEFGAHIIQNRWEAACMKSGLKQRKELGIAKQR